MDTWVIWVIIPHNMDEETGSERLINLPKITQVG